jgi:hypothetical protein
MPFSAKVGFFSQQATGGGGATNWDPSQITTQAWVKAEASELTLSGTNVTSWNNKANGTNTVDYSNATSSEQPTWDSGDGHVLFDGVDDYLQADSAFSFTSDEAIMVVSVIDIVAKSGYFSGVADKFYQQSGPPGGGSSAHGAYSVAAGDSVGWNNRFNNGATTFGSAATATKLLTVGTMGASAQYQNAEWYLDGTSLTASGSSGNTLNMNDAYSYLGGGPGGSTNQFMYANVKMYELVCLEDNSTTNRQLLEGYMAWEHGIESRLPADHPYKNARPTV